MAQAENVIPLPFASSFTPSGADVQARNRERYFRQHAAQIVSRLPPDQEEARLVISLAAQLCQEWIGGARPKRPPLEAAPNVRRWAARVFSDLPHTACDALHILDLAEHLRRRWLAAAMGDAPGVFQKF